ncbi:hypothetical protein MRX96_002306 [Rhipicephalus microplus]
MAVREYTLTGFSDFLERRRVGFVEQLPPNRVYAVCGMVPSQVSDIALRSHAVQAVQKSDHRARRVPLGWKAVRRRRPTSGGPQIRASGPAAKPSNNRVNTLLDRISCIQSNVSREADVEDGARGGDWEGASAGSTTKPPVAPGPYRAAAKPGVYIETCRFVDVYSAYNAMKQGDVKRSMLTGTYTLAGYTFKLACELFKNEKKEVYTRFAFIPATRRLGRSRGLAFPQKGELYWKHIEEHGYIGNKALYVNVQFE